MEGNELCHSTKDNHTSDVGMFRLADETQMGGLNSLLSSSTPIGAIKTEEPIKKGETNDILCTTCLQTNSNLSCFTENYDQQALHHVLGETRLFFQRTISGSSDSDSYMNGGHSLQKPNAANRSGTPSSPDKAYEFDFDDEVTTKKSTRACKGKRYQEFMNSQKAVVAPKKSKLRTTSSSSSTSFSSSADSHSYANNHKILNGLTSIKIENESHDYGMEHAQMRISDQNGHAYRRSSLNDDSKFYANNFDLDEKIKALPALDLDLYLLRKRDTKKRKKVVGNKRNNKVAHAKAAASSKATTAVTAPTPAKVAKIAETAIQAKARMIMVGSQKRKARKESITRREVVSATATVESIIMDDNRIVYNNTVTNGGTNDLLFLATVAETLQ